MIAYKAVIIGSGAAGTALAKDFAKAGWKTALIEAEAVGGSCVNRGCTPTKTLIASGHAAHIITNAARFGINVPSYSIDMERVRARKRQLVAYYRDGLQESLSSMDNLDLIFGAASFIAPYEIEVRSQKATRRLTAEYVFIDTGARPAKLKIPGADSLPILDSTTIMELGEIPEHLVVIGGGYIGLEFGHLFRRLGSRVTLVVRGDRVLKGEDGDISADLLRIFIDDGIDVRLGTHPKDVEKRGDRLRLGVTMEGKEEVIEASHILAAIGRKPMSDTLNLENAGLQIDAKGFVPVNDRLETSVPRIFALGDLKGGPAYTHISYDDYRIVKANLLDGQSLTITGRLVPFTLFTDPQLGRVGIGEEEARQRGLSIKIFKLPMRSVMRAVEIENPRGFLKAVVDAKTDKILGFCALGAEGGEIMSIVETAMIGNLPYTALRDAIWAHPTLAEGLNSLFTALA